MSQSLRVVLASLALLIAPAFCRADDATAKDAILVEIDPSGALKIDGEPFKGDVTPAALKAKFQSIRDKTGRKAIVLMSDVSKPQRASALVVEAADGAGMAVKLAKP
ncbi:MAG TPA: hypothetical protein VG406_02115, partial [Isosphaeraceae bacterium]|nr:hypothetical protein [Isosphaeraceae bacterium]